MPGDRPRPRVLALLGAVGLTVAAGCATAGDQETLRAPVEEPTTTATTATTTATSSPPVVIELRLERRTTEGTDGFEDLVRSTLADPRGWTRAGFSFRFSDDAPYRVVVAEADEVDATCLPYDTGGRYSCQIGPTIALNADRWRGATETWTGTLDDYRRMLVNHEVGHLLGRHHARPACEEAVAAAAVMFQQSSGLDGCTPNPWPLDWEIACAARHDEPIAPGYEADATATCGPDDV